MQLSLRLGKLLKKGKETHGIVQEIARETGLERHCVSALVRGSAKYVSLDALGRISEYLAQKHDIDPRTLAAELLAFQPNEFWTMLAGCKRFQFCLGKRYVPKWVDKDYIMASDSYLQGALLSRISEPRQRRGTTGLDVEKGAEAPVQYFPSPHLILSPAHESEKSAAKDGRALLKVIDKARELRKTSQQHVDSGLIALGSVKVNTLVEVLCAEWFGTEPGNSQDDVKSPRNRGVPLFFRYRDEDVQPPSCCGGVRLAKRHPATEPGIYFESEGGEWKRCVCDAEYQDAAFLMYTYQPELNQVELACGGFSGHATAALAARLDGVVTGVKPQYKSDHLWMGMYVFQITYKASKRASDHAAERCDFQIFPVAESALAQRLPPVQETSPKRRRRTDGRARPKRRPTRAK